MNIKTPSAKIEMGRLWGKLLDEWGTGGWAVAEIDSGPGPALLMPSTKTGERYVSHSEEGGKKGKKQVTSPWPWTTAVLATWSGPRHTLGTRRYLRPDQMQYRAN